MNSSISASEPAAGSTAEAHAEAAWRRWLLVYASILAGSLAFVFVAVVVLDPFSTGRLSPVRTVSIATEKRMFAHAGRIRDPRFNAAIFGNSRAFSIEPARLGRMTGYRIVHLAMEALLPPEQLFLLRAFVRNRLGQAPLIIMVLDTNWCVSSLTHTSYELPRWLYEGSNLQYLRRILSPLAAKAALVRLSILIGVMNDVRRIDGYDPWLPREAPTMRQRMLNTPPPTEGEPVTAPFPALDELKKALANLDPDSPVMLMFPPVYAGSLPVSGSAAEARVEMCKDRIRKIAKGRARTDFLDLRKDAPNVRDPMNFMDHVHFLDPVAREVEAALAPLIRQIAARQDAAGQ